MPLKNKFSVNAAADKVIHIENHNPSISKFNNSRQNSFNLDIDSEENPIRISIPIEENLIEVSRVETLKNRLNIEVLEDF